MKVYIPSYFGKDPKLVAKRIAIHNKQIDWLLQSDIITDIIVCSQDYPENVKLIHKKIHYIDALASSPAIARNVLLKYHYKTGDKICMFLDNDITTDNYSIDMFIKISEELTNHTDWNLLCMYPYGISKETTSLPECLTFARLPHLSSACFFMNGIYDLFFDESLRDMEDMEFAMHALTKKFSYYEIQKYCLFKHSSSGSVIYEKGIRNRKIEYDVIRTQIRERYDGIVKGMGFSSMHNFINSFKQPKKVVIYTDANSKKRLF